MALENYVVLVSGVGKVHEEWNGAGDCRVGVMRSGMVLENYVVLVEVVEGNSLMFVTFGVGCCFVDGLSRQLQQRRL
jgi:NADH:ubiquinone oxidoreductase subunit B-like Fe-S oxidoreductase